MDVSLSCAAANRHESACCKLRLGGNHRRPFNDSLRNSLVDAIRIHPRRDAEHALRIRCRFRSTVST
jgi:hypothetical protein